MEYNPKKENNSEILTILFKTYNGLLGHDTIIFNLVKKLFFYMISFNISFTQPILCFSDITCIRLFPHGEWNEEEDNVETRYNNKIRI